MALVLIENISGFFLKAPCNIIYFSHEFQDVPFLFKNLLLLKLILWGILFHIHYTEN